MEPKKKFLTSAAVAGGLILLYGSGLIRWAERKGTQARLESEIACLREENQRLYQEARRLREDPAYAEAVARRQLGFVRPGETVIRLKGQKPEPAKRPAPSRSVSNSR